MLVSGRPQKNSCFSLSQKAGKRPMSQVKLNGWSHDPARGGKDMSLRVQAPLSISPPTPSPGQLRLKLWLTSLGTNSQDQLHTTLLVFSRFTLWWLTLRSKQNCPLVLRSEHRPCGGSPFDLESWSSLLLLPCVFPNCGSVSSFLLLLVNGSPKPWRC